MLASLGATFITLRYYDEIGLVTPDYINEDNGYRYYSFEKLTLIGKIQELKGAGLQLEDIRAIIDDNLSASQRLELLAQRKNDLVYEILSYQKTLEKLDQMIHQTKEEKYMEKVVIKGLPEVIVASCRTTIPTYDSLFEVVPKMGKVMEIQGAVCREPAYCFNIYHDGECREKDIDVEICEAVNDYCKNSDGVVYKKIPAVSEAVTIFHHGPYETLGKSYASLFSWMKENGYSPSDNPRESYIDGIWNRDNPHEWLTEIQIPVTKTK